MLRSAVVSWRDSSPHRMFAPAIALNARSPHLGLALRAQKFSKPMLVASVAVIREFKSGVLEAFSSNEMPRYFASGTLLSNVPSPNGYVEVLSW